MSARTFAIKHKSAIALSGSTTLFPLYYQAPSANMTAKVLEVSMSTDQATASATRIRFDFCRLSTLGTFTTLTQAIKFDPDGPAIKGTFGHTGSSGQVVNALDGDEDDIPFSEYILSGYTWRPPAGLIVPINGIVAIRAVSTTNGANLMCRIVVQEGAD